MIYTMNYTNNNNNQYNYTNNYPNQNYFNQINQNNLKAMYRNSSNFSNSSSNNNSNNKYKLKYVEINNKKPNRPKKKVKFNGNVTIIKVESYKEYNKIDEDINLDNIFNSVGPKQAININKKKGDNCECTLI